MNKQKISGVTVLESIIVIAIVGIISALAVPSYRDMIERTQLRQVVEGVKSDLQLARTKAIKQSESVIVSRTTGNAGTWCYGLARNAPITKTSCNCKLTDTSNANYCDIKIVSGAGFASTDMYSNSGNSTFDFRRGTIGNNGITFTSTHYAARVVFSQVGRIRICSPSTAANPMPPDRVGLPGLSNCTED